MGKIILFKPQPRSRRAAKGIGSAQILFFTGVRYERMKEPVQPKRPSGGGKKTGANRSQTQSA